MRLPGRIRFDVWRLGFQDVGADDSRFGNRGLGYEASSQLHAGYNSHLRESTMLTLRQQDPQLQRHIITAVVEHVFAQTPCGA